MAMWEVANSAALSAGGTVARSTNDTQCMVAGPRVSRGERRAFKMTVLNPPEWKEANHCLGVVPADLDVSEYERSLPRFYCVVETDTCIMARNGFTKVSVENKEGFRLQSVYTVLVDLVAARVTVTTGSSVAIFTVPESALASGVRCAAGIRISGQVTIEEDSFPARFAAERGGAMKLELCAQEGRALTLGNRPSTKDAIEAAAAAATIGEKLEIGYGEHTVTILVTAKGADVTIDGTREESVGADAHLDFSERACCVGDACIRWAAASGQSVSNDQGRSASLESVRSIASPAEFEQLLRSAGTVVVDFYAVWCGPCRQIAPTFEALADEFTGPTFVKVPCGHTLPRPRPPCGRALSVATRARPRRSDGRALLPSHTPFAPAFLG